MVNGTWQPLELTDDLKLGGFLEAFELSNENGFKTRIAIGENSLIAINCTSSNGGVFNINYCDGSGSFYGDTQLLAEVYNLAVSKLNKKVIKLLKEIQIWLKEKKVVFA